MNARARWPAWVATYVRTGHRFMASRILTAELGELGPALVLKSMALATAADAGIMGTYTSTVAGVDPVADAYLLVALVADPDPAALDVACRTTAAAGPDHVARALTALCDLLADAA